MKVTKWAGAHLVPALLLGGATALLTASGGFAYSEHAVVKVFVVPQRVQVDDVALDSALRSTRLVASATETLQVTSNVVAVPATAATGRVTFMCSPMTLCPNGYTVPAGTVLESTAGVEYRTLSSVSFPSCAPSSPVTITALAPGSAGNAAVGGIAYARVPSYIHVTNPWPVVGGADAYSLPVVDEPSVDAALKTLIDKVSSELPAQLQAKAGGLTYLTTGPASLTTGGDYRIGSHAPTFTVQVSGTLTAVAFPTGGARELMRRALSRRVPTGYELAPEQITASFSLQPAAPAADAAVRGAASGYMIPAINARALAASIRGKSLTAAANMARRASADGGSPQIQMTPVAMPWLPVVADHISVLIVVEPDSIIRR